MALNKGLKKYVDELREKRIKESWVYVDLNTTNKQETN